MSNICLFEKNQTTYFQEFFLKVVQHIKIIEYPGILKKYSRVNDFLPGLRTNALGVVDARLLPSTHA